MKTPFSARYRMCVIVLVISCINAHPAKSLAKTPQPITVENAPQITELARLGTGTLTTSRWSPDARTLAIGTSLNIRLYHAGNPNPLILPETGYTSDLAFSADGRFLASVHRSIVRLWEASTGKLLGLWGNKTYDSVTGISFVGKSTILAISNVTPGDGYAMQTGVWLWDYSSSQATPKLPILGYVEVGKRNTAFNTNLTQIATTSNDMQNGSGLNIFILGIWDAISGKNIQTIRQIGDRIIQLTYSPTDDNLLVTLDDRGVVRLWDTQAGLERFALTLPYDQVQTVAFSLDGQQIATGGSDHEVRCWSTTDGSLLKVYPGQPYTVTQLTYQPDGIILAADTTHAWNAQTLQGQRAFTVQNLSPSFSDVSFSGQSLFALANDKTIWHWTLANLKRSIIWQGIDFSHNNGAFSPDGKLLAGFDVATGNLYLWRLTYNDIPTILHSHPVSWVDRMQFSPDGKQLILATSGDDQTNVPYEIDAWQLADPLAMSTKRLLAADAVFGNFVFHPTESIIAYTANNEIHLRNLNTNEDDVLGKSGSEFEVPPVFSPDGTLLASYNAPFSIDIWNLANRTVISQISASDPQAMQFSPDGKLLLANFGQEVDLYNVADGTTLKVLQGHTDSITKAQFSADQRLIASSSMDGTLRLWGVQ